MVAMRKLFHPGKLVHMPGKPDMHSYQIRDLMDFPQRCPSQDVQYSLSNENLGLLGEDVGVTLVKDGHGGAAEGERLAQSYT
jgi:hypothetical protein